MTTILIIGAVLAGVLILAVLAVRIARRGGRALQKSEDARLSAEHEAKVSKAVADELAIDRTADEIADEWSKPK